jgi:2-deoxy-D-gluconate 3-dehydrogenase
MYSIFGAPFQASYAASKGGVVALTRSLAVELAPHNIQVNALAPGWLLTDMTGYLQGTDYEKEILARTPAGRWGVTEDIKGPAVFLASEASDFVTGQVLAVDGGFSVR